MRSGGPSPANWRLGSSSVRLKGKHARRVGEAARGGSPGAGSAGWRRARGWAEGPPSGSGSRRARPGDAGVRMLAAPDLVDDLVAQVTRLQLGPALEQPPGARVEPAARPVQGLLDPGARALVDHGQGGLQPRHEPRKLDLLLRPVPVGAHGAHDLGQVADAVRGDRPRRAGVLLRRGADVAGKPDLGPATADGPRHLGERGEQRVHAGIAEAAGDRAVDAQRVGGGVERLSIALHLFRDVAQRVFPSAAIELVHGDEVGVVQHPDLLELARRTVLGGHHVDGDVGEIHDLRVALADAGRLDDHPVVARESAEPDGVRDRGGELPAGGPRGEGPHHRPRVRERVHADAVAEQGAARPPAGRIDTEDGHRGVRRPLEVTEDQLVHERRLPGAARPGDADHGRPFLGGQAVVRVAQHPRQGGVGEVLALDDREEPADRPVVVGIERG